MTFPESLAPVVLRASKRRALLNLLGCLGFALVGVFMIVGHDRRGWFVAIFFGGVAVLGLRAVLMPPLIGRDALTFESLLPLEGQGWWPTASTIPAVVGVVDGTG